MLITLNIPFNFSWFESSGTFQVVSPHPTWICCNSELSHAAWVGKGILDPCCLTYYAISKQIDLGIWDFSGTNIQSVGGADEYVTSITCGSSTIIDWLYTHVS